MGYRSSGNRTVDAMGSIAITGNVIPEEWYKHILKPTTGKPYLLAITILADLVYWHRPTEVRDERTGEVIGWKKKFHGEMLQKSYQEYANKFGESKKTIKLAFDQLVTLGVIRRVFYNIEYADGRTIPNQMFIDLNIKALKDISYPEEEGSATDKQLKRKLVPAGFDDTAENTAETGDFTDVEKNGYISPQNGRDMLTNLSGYPDKNVPISPLDFSVYGDKKGAVSCSFGEGYPDEIFRTNTDINTKDCYRDHIISVTAESGSGEMDRMDEIKQNSVVMDRIVRSNINYEWHMDNDSISEREDYHELYLLIHDVVCGEHTEPIIVNKTAMDPEVVKSRFLKLNQEHLAYVIDRLKENPNRNGIRDIRSYMLTCLYNAPVTMGQYFQQWVNHDFTSGALLGGTQDME